MVQRLRRGWTSPRASEIGGQSPTTLLQCWLVISLTAVNTDNHAFVGYCLSPAVDISHIHVRQEVKQMAALRQTLARCHVHLNIEQGYEYEGKLPFFPRMLHECVVKIINLFSTMQHA